jgi:formamidopyrimidine-DNA glycosylase
MPELPEMETYRKLLTEKIAHQQITEVEVNREKSVNTPVDAFIQEVRGQTILTIERRAKHLLFHLNNNKTLLLHLMLGGWMFYGDESNKPDRTIQVKLSFGGMHLYFIGLRLGYLHVHDKEEVPHVLEKLGPEPLNENFTENTFQQLMGPKRGMLKTTLIDQSFLSGIGNCYSDEICFSTGLLPMKRGTELSEEDRSRLYHSIRAVLSEAIQFGGYMESPLYVGDQLTGGFDAKCKVYDREGGACFRCGHPIIKDELSSRKTFYCQVCQH